MTASVEVVTQEATFEARVKRSMLQSMPLFYAGNQEINELSHRVLRSIEAATVAKQDGANCLRRALCEDNRYSRETNDGRKIWLPFWSLGMSWLSGRIQKKTPWSATLDSVKAAIFGLGGADCESLYPKCNLQREKLKRRRRRRK